MTFEKAVKETDRLLARCDRLRAKQKAIEAKIKALQEQRKEVNDKWQSYDPLVKRTGDVIAATLKEKRAHLIGGYYRLQLDEPFVFRIVDITYGWNEKILEHRDMLELVTYTATIDKCEDLIIHPEHKFSVYAKDLVPATKEELSDYISKAKYEYKQGRTYGYLSWEKTEIER